MKVVDDGLLRLDEDECWSFIARHVIGRVAFIQLGEPVVFPVNYILDGHSIVFRTAPGTKLAMAAIERSAVFEVDEVTEALEVGTSVMVHGTLHEVTDRAERERLAALPLRPWAAGEREHFVRVTPYRITGRRIRPHDNDGLAADAG